MLQPVISISQNPLDFNKLVLKDITPAFDALIAQGGYGAPNIARSEVDYIQLALTTPDGRDWATDPLKWSPTSDSLEIWASDFLPVLVNQGDIVYDPCAPPAQRKCGRQGKLSFVDGLYELTYEVFGRKGIPNDLISYHLDVTLCDGERVFVKRQGAWSDITEQGSVDVRGNWTWTALNTVLVYQEYEVRKPLEGNAFRLQDAGFVEKVSVPDSEGSMTTSTDPKLVAAVTIRFILTGVVASDMAKLANRPLPDFAAVDFCADSLLPLVATRQQLDTLIAIGKADETALIILKSIQNNIQYLKTVVYV